jgi:hypothetical protein
MPGTASIICSMRIECCHRHQSRRSARPRIPRDDLDERNHGFDRRSSSAWAKYADALRRISFACRSSRFSRSSVFIRSRPSLVRLPLVALGLPHSLAQRLARAADLRCNRTHRCPLRRVIPSMLQPHAYRAFPDFRRKSICYLPRHSSTFSSYGSLRQTWGGSILPSVAPAPSPASILLA